jgi:septal ring factor EnvC (AmiA/AmiB activator)
MKGYALYISMALCLTLALFLTGCDAYVEKEKYEALQKEMADLKQRLGESQESLRKAQEQVAQCQAHKYEIFHNGFRTWRLDTVTGATCILLTTTEDWKKPETNLASCEP